MPTGFHRAVRSDTAGCHAIEASWRFIQLFSLDSRGRLCSYFVLPPEGDPFQPRTEAAGNFVR
jgi:hypothetical protein